MQGWPCWYSFEASNKRVSGFEVTIETICPRCVVCAALVSQAAMDILEEMSEAGLEMDAFTYAHAIQACCNAGNRVCAPLQYRPVPPYGWRHRLDY